MFSFMSEWVSKWSRSIVSDSATPWTVAYQAPPSMEFWYCQNCLPKQLYYFAFLTAPNENSCCSTSLSAFGIVSVLNFGHSNMCVVVSHCCFNLHFHDDKLCGTSFHLLAICVSSLVKCLLSFLVNIYIYIFLVHFLNWVVIFLLLSFKNSLCILNNSPLSVCLLQLFSPSLYVFFSFF